MTIVTIICRHREGERRGTEYPPPLRRSAGITLTFPLAGKVLSGVSPGARHQM